jgi:hypothetical protein
MRPRQQLAASVPVAAPRIAAGATVAAVLAHWWVDESWPDAIGSGLACAVVGLVAAFGAATKRRRMSARSR